jgi:hypothetical protein
MDEITVTDNSKFDDWFYEIQGFSMRSEYFYGDCVNPDEQKRKDLMYQWLVCAYNQGMKHT